MTGTPLDLLSLVRVGSGLLNSGRSSPKPAPTGDASFASLLRKAEMGEVSSGREVTVGKGVDLKLDKEQLARLSAVADRAEASGALNLMVMMDGKAMKLDVQSRTITAVSDPASGQVITGVDAVVTVPGSGDAPTAGAPPILPYPRAAGGLNPSLAKAITPAA